MLVEALILIALILFVVYKKCGKPSKMPPGSFGFPVLGSFPPSGVPVTEHFRQLKRKHGSIFTTKWGSRVIVVLADYAIIKKGLSHPDFQGRMALYTFSLLNDFQNIGVVFSENEVWKETRRFLLRNLRDLGMGKTRMNNSIQQEAEMLVHYLEQHNLDKPTELDLGINVAVLNVIWQMLASKRYDANDEYIRKYNKLTDETMDILQGRAFILDVLPWLLDIFPDIFIKKFFKIGLLLQHRDDLHAMLMETIREHETNLDPENPRDVIDNYLLEMKRHKDDPDTNFLSDYKHLISVMADMFGAGSETTSTTLRWFILYMAIYPEIQKKAQQILDEVVPAHRLPSLDDKDQLPYIDALILDTLRLSSLIPTNLPHRTTATVTFEGYTIPEGTMIMSCLELCHRDPDLWEKPDVLCPQHFLDENGRLDSKKDGFMPFSVGRRQCLGESLARMEVFLFAAAILQRFSISCPPGVTLKAETDPNKKLLNQPMPFKVVLKKRL